MVFQSGSWLRTVSRRRRSHRRAATRGYRGSDDGLGGRPIVLKHDVDESDRLGEKSAAKRRGDPERDLALQFNRFRNSYVTD